MVLALIIGTENVGPGNWDTESKNVGHGNWDTESENVTLVRGTEMLPCHVTMIGTLNQKMLALVIGTLNQKMLALENVGPGNWDTESENVVGH